MVGKDQHLGLGVNAAFEKILEPYCIKITGQEGRRNAFARQAQDSR